MSETLSTQERACLQADFEATKAKKHAERTKAQYGNRWKTFNQHFASYQDDSSLGIRFFDIPHSDIFEFITQKSKWCEGEKSSRRGYDEAFKANDTKKV